MELNLCRFTILATMACASSIALAQAKTDLGKQEYEWHCATCHGVNGTGNGELRRYLTTAPSDLTTIAKRNGGTFPNQLVWEMIDGRLSTEIGPHGSREMPVWGQRYRAEASRNLIAATEPEWYVRNRVVALLDYLSRIQQK